MRISHMQTELFQGKLTYKKYFEGWYFKHTSLSSGKSIAFIPGISLNPNDRHAFIQVIQSRPLKTFYFRYSLDQFHTSDNPFSVSIGDSFFSLTETRINIQDDQNSFKGHLKYDHLSPIQRSIGTPNIMGFFSYLPKMACKHGILSMNHDVNGTLTLPNDDVLHFSHDRGYIEKDWGHSFPEKYIWSQANHFTKNNTSLMVSVATIPLLHTSFIGHICNLQIGDEEYRFATYNRSNIVTLKITDRHILLILSKKHARLEIEAWLDDSKELKAPRNGLMTDTIKEGLGGQLSFKLFEKEQLICADTSDFAGIEVVKMMDIHP